MNRQGVVALVAVAGALSWTYAFQAAAQQPRRFGGGRMVQWRERMQDAAKQLNLTDEQKAKLKELYGPQREKFREIWKDQNLTREQKMEKFKALRAENEPKLRETLTPEQREKIEQRLAQARERAEKAKQNWNLTDEQKAKLKAVLRPQMEKFRELRQNQDLTLQQKLEKWKALREELSPEIKKVLTPEQFEKWEQARGQWWEQARNRWRAGKK